MPTEGHHRDHPTQVDTTIDHSIDSLARELAHGNLSRSQMLRRTGTVLLGVALASIPGVAWAARPPGLGPSGGKGCREVGQTRCKGACVFLSSDPSNCGACGNACPAEYVCVNGTCQQCANITLTRCSGKCTDLSEDPNNCGACGNVCSAEMACRGGTCICDDFPYNDNCAGTCVNLSGDPNNCGACGNVCPPTQGCQDGVCGCICPSPEFCTADCGGDGICVSLRNNNNNCGTCGNVCPPGTGCAFSTCVPFS